MAISTKLARSVPEFLRVVSLLSDRWEGPWFRGIDRFTYPLIPRRYRYRLVDEDEIRSEFKRRATQLMIGRAPQTDGSGTHWGFPTRLLDWSEGALLALHFALISNKSQSDAAVWVLDPFWLNGQVMGNDKLLPDPDDPRDEELLKTYLPDSFPTRRARLAEFPIALQPAHVDRRIAAQLSSFTIHGREPYGLEALAEKTAVARLAKIKIPRGSVKRMLEQMLDAGVTESTVYPDLYGLSLELTRLYAKRPRYWASKPARRASN